MIHRDIKAANVLAYKNEGVPNAKVIDFGLVDALAENRLIDATFNTVTRSTPANTGFPSRPRPRACA